MTPLRIPPPDWGDGFCVFFIYRAASPIVVCAVAWDARADDSAWGCIEGIYLFMGDNRPDVVAPGALAKKPDSLPWLAVLILPSIISLTKKDVLLLGDIEKCFAMTILDSVK